MIKRILPIYQTGWFYLLLLLWASSYWYIASGGLNQLNQLNIKLLYKVEPAKVKPENLSSLDTMTPLVLQSSFNEQDVNSITRLLSAYPNSQITLLGEQSSLFITKLEDYLFVTPRKNKIIIASKKAFSATAAKSQTTSIFANPLDWFRYSEKSKLKQKNSEHFIFTPLLLNQRQSFPLLWQQQGDIYLSLHGELLKQLNNELMLNRGWQLSLTGNQNSLTTSQWPLGFFGEIFTAGNTYQLVQEDQISADNLEQDLTSLTSVSQFIEQQQVSKSTSTPLIQHKLIIITDKQLPQYTMVSTLLDKLLSHDYLYQSLTAIFLCWFLLIVGIGLTWFIRHLSHKKQSICLLSYLLILLAIQYYFFTKQQWFELPPVILIVSLSWLLVLAYQREASLFLAAYYYPSATQKPSKAQVSGLSKQRQTAKIKKPLVKTPTPSKRKQAKANVTHRTSTIAAAKQAPAEDFEQTLVIVDNPAASQASTNHHIQVKDFGRYQVEGILGKGAMGIVYQGVDPKINRHVAIKTLQLSDDINSPEFAEAKDRFFREAQTAGSLSHANIVTIYDVGEEDNLGYIAMDLLTGAPLSLFTQPGQTLPAPLIYQLLIQITDALDYAHQQNIVHRDIKPANIIYDDDLLKVTVTDFGIAYVSDNSKTRTGIIMGSPYYMSPEQILGLKVDGRSDIFSLGVTFYQLLCGHLPFEGESIATVAYQITKAKAVSVNQRNTALPSSALRITNKAMHKDIEKRYQSMAEFKSALVSALKRDFKTAVH